MKLITSFSIVALTLALHVCSARRLSSASSVEIDTTATTTNAPSCGWTFWEWITGSGCSAAAPVQENRPDDRPQVVCSTWCPSGYTRREVSIGPECSFYVLGKCVDRTGYHGESCGFSARTCVQGAGLSCQQATAEDAEENAHPQACYSEP